MKKMERVQPQPFFYVGVNVEEPKALDDLCMRIRNNVRWTKSNLSIETLGRRPSYHLHHLYLSKFM